ncbi:hypothetical protein SBY92_003212 [Candida maltosa Xu316]
MSDEFPTLTLEEFKTAIKEVSQFELENKKEQQKHFIFKLIETNNELLQEIDKLKNDESEEAKSDLKLYQETILENKHSLLEQIARVESINDELIRRHLISEQVKKQDEEKLLNDINEKDVPGTKKETNDKKEGVYL